LDIKSFNTALDALPVEAAARIHESLIRQGILYIPWEARNAELKAAYVPLVGTTHVSRLDADEKVSGVKRRILEQKYKLLDKVDLYYPEKSKQESAAESLVTVVAKTMKVPSPVVVDGFRRIRFWERWMEPYKR